MIRKKLIFDSIIDLYEEFEISTFGFDLRDICEKMEVNLIPYSAFDDKKTLLLKRSEDGFNFFNPYNNHIEIYYNDEQIPKDRIKFTIPHELGHISLNHYYLSKDTNVNKESEANVFANEFYVPQAFILYYKMFTTSELISNFGITYEYARVLLDKLSQRPNKNLTSQEEQLIEIFEKNKTNKKSGR